MSLKVFHVFFISVSVLLCLGFGGWCFFSETTVKHPGYLAAGTAAVLCAVGLAVYEVMFLRNFKNTK